MLDLSADDMGWVVGAILAVIFLGIVLAIAGRWKR
jgi:hypothetical protein